MAQSFISTAAGTSADYRTYLYDAPVKDDRGGDAILFNFTLAKTDSSFVKLNRGNYIKFTTNTYGVWFTGYVTNEPEYVYLGSAAGVPQWGYKYEASSDEIILSQNSLGILPPFLNATQGEIIKSLAERIAPGLFDYTNVDDGLTLARYVVDPTKKFSDVVKDFSNSAVFRFYGKDLKLYFTSQDALPQGVTIDGNATRFTPSDLSLKASTSVPIINDVVVLGDVEPQNFVTEYFIGTGSDGQESLVQNVFGVESTVLLDDNFSSNGFDNSKWTVYDDPQTYLNIFNGYFNIIGGPANGKFVHLDSASLVPLGGNLRITHGDFDFVPQGGSNVTCGLIGALYVSPPANTTTDLITAGHYTGCVFGIAVNKVSGVLKINPVVNEILDSSQSVTLQPNAAAGNPLAWNATPTYVIGDNVYYSGTYYTCISGNTSVPPPSSLGVDWALTASKRYVLRTVLTGSRVFRGGQEYNYLGADGTVGNIPANEHADTITAQTYITEIDPNTGLITAGFPQVWVNTFNVTSGQVYANYVLAASNDLHCTITNTTLSTPMQAQLAILPKGGSAFVSKLIGPNEVDSSDGLSPFATIAQSGGKSQRQNILGTPQLHAGNPTLQFFKNTAALASTVPQVGDIVQLRYRSAGVAMGRARDNSSINTEGANWSDTGVRSIVRNGDVSPLPATALDCEAAATAIVKQNAYTHYEGTYKVISDNVTAEPVAGAILPFVNLPAAAFPATSFNEPITEVKTTFLVSGGGEKFMHDVSFGLKNDSTLLRGLLAKFQRQSDVFSPQDTAETPKYVPVAGVGLAYGGDVTDVTLDMSGGHPLGVDSTSIYFQINNFGSVPTDGGFEARYTDEGWGCDDGSNLAARFTGSTFNIPRNARGKVIFIKSQDGRNIVSTSEDWRVNDGAGHFTNSRWSHGFGSTIEQVYGIGPDNTLMALNKFTNPSVGVANSIQQYTQQVTQIAGSHATCSVSLKGAAGLVISVIFSCNSGGCGSTTQFFTMNGSWQRVTLTMPLTCNTFDSMLVNIGCVGASVFYGTMASIEMNSSVESIYVKTSSNIVPSLGTAYGANSRYAAVVHTAYPLIPGAPTATVDTTDRVNPVISVTLPAVADDVWGIEVRASDNTTVIYSADLADAGYSPLVTVVGNSSRSLSYYVYTYNLLKEYSSSYHLTASIGTPTVASLAIADATKTLTWVGTDSTHYTVEVDSVDNSFNSEQIIDTTDVVDPTQFLILTSNDFFGHRFFRVTPRDAIGAGTGVILEHTYLPPAPPGGVHFSGVNPRTAWSIFGVDSTRSGYPASNVLDGNPWSCWSSNAGGAGYIIIDFGVAGQTFDAIQIRNRSDQNRGQVHLFDILASNDHITYTTLASGLSGYQDIGGLHTFGFAGNPVTYRYLKLDITSVYDIFTGSNIVIAEIFTLRKNSITPVAPPVSRGTISVPSGVSPLYNDEYINRVQRLYGLKGL